MRKFPNPELATGILLWLLIVLTYALYSPGISGSFIFDDYPNLGGLDKVKSLTDLRGLVDYLSTPVAGALGRPISLLSFALQQYSWRGGEPADFIQLNILLHLINGCLLFWLAVLLLRRLPQIPPAHQGLLALATTAIWITHPINTSSVLYVVQRMNELAVLFTLVGLLCAAKGAELLQRSPLPDRRPLFLLYLAFGLALVLAVFSKENGILLCIYALIIGHFFYRETPGALWRWWRYGYLIAPLVVLAAYFMASAERLIFEYSTRDYSMGERLLSEARVLFNYLGKLFLPRPGEFGIYFDDYPKSSGLLTPATTLLALGGWMAAIAAAIRWRNGAYWLFSFAVMWYLGGHLLESSFLPLELYFEHRNYLAAFGPLFGAVVGLYLLFARYQPEWRVKAVVLVGLAFLAATVVTTVGEVRIWGNKQTASLLWKEEKPHSRRAVAEAAITYVNIGRYDKAVDIYRSMADNDPSDPVPLMLWLLLDCVTEVDELPQTSAILQRLHSDEYFLVTYVLLDKMLANVADKACPHIEMDTVVDMIAAIQDNPTYKWNLYETYFLRARHALLTHEPLLAVLWLDESTKLKADPSLTVMQAEILATLGMAKEADIYRQKALHELKYKPLRRFVHQPSLDYISAQIAKAATNDNQRQ